MHRRTAQRGAAALFVTVLLCFAMILLVAAAHRDVAVEESRSANDYRAAAAFEAAEAGLEWMLARINDPTPLSAQCLPSTAPGALSLRDRLLRIDVASGAIEPASWNDHGLTAPLQTACRRDAAGWACSCPSTGWPALPVASDTATAPGFVVRLVAAPRPGTVAIAADGCTRGEGGGVCAPSGDGGHRGRAHLEAGWALLPALRAAPAAAMTVRGDVEAGSAALTLANDDRACNGLALHAGGRIAAAGIRIAGATGAPLAGAVAPGDETLASLSSAQFFARYFGMDVSAWSRQPAVHRVSCSGDCSAALVASVAAGRRLLYIDGDLTLRGPATLGSLEQPVVVVATGAVQLTGDVAIQGVLHAGSLRWDDAVSTSAQVRGATLVAGDYRGNAAASFIRDGTVLDRLKTDAGSFVRINGSWKDF